MALVTERWSARRMRLGVDADREFDVDQVRNETEAGNAAGVPRKGESHPQDASILAEAPDVQQFSPMPAFRVRVHYAVPTLNPAEDPKGGGESKRPRISWGKFKLSIQTDTDYDGNPLVNSAGDAIDPPQTIELPVRVLTVKRWEKFGAGSGVLLDDFEDHVNANDITIEGRTFKAKQVLCETILPMEEIEVGVVRNVPIGYTFWMLKGKHTWEWKFIDQGFRATYQNPTTSRNVPGELFTNGNTQVSREIRLDGNGRPFETGLVKIERDGKTPAQNDTPKGITLERRDKCVVLIYKKFPEKDFSPLGIF